MSINSWRAGPYLHNTAAAAAAAGIAVDCNKLAEQQNERQGMPNQPAVSPGGLPDLNSHSRMRDSSCPRVLKGSEVSI
jgi:hypothetical protein